MNWIYIALISHFLYALVFIFDKYILARPIKSSLAYAFYTSFFGGFIAIIIPFYDFHILAPADIFYALVAGAGFAGALIFFYHTLQASEASRAVPFVGALVPAATLLFSFPLGLDRLSSQHLLAFIFLVVGGLLIIFGYRNHNFWSTRNILFAVSAALLFGFSFALTKFVFNSTNFVSGLIWTRWGSFLFAVVLLLKKSWREDIFEATLASNEKTAIWFFSSKAIGATAVILQNYAIFLGSVVLVNALQSTQFLFLLVLATALAVKLPKVFEETIERVAIIQKVFSIVIISIGLLILAIPHAQPKPLSYGVTFSQKFAQELSDPNDGVEAGWKRMYTDLLDDLKIRDFRLVAYWDRVEPEEGRFDFEDLDWLLQEAEKRDARVLLAFGRKTPRWPECHVPDWVENIDDEERLDDAILRYIASTVEYYKDDKTIYAWQVENEPLFPFGECGTFPIKFLREEVNLVRSLDDRPIVLTDAGELGFAWPFLATRADIFGTTLYRYVHNRVLGDTDYWFVPSALFRVKAWWAQSVWNKEILINELQAEPWMPKPLSESTLEEQYKTMSPEKFRNVIEYAEKSDFEHAYLWGAEWWWWLKEERGNDAMWEEVRGLISKSEARNTKQILNSNE